jgi:hypothetical protein
MTMSSIGRAIAGLALSVSTVWAQGPASQPSGIESSYLMRLERIREGLDVCVLVRGDGQYHLERHLSEKSKILEGNLDADEMHQVIHIVSDDQFFFLQQNQIPESMLRSKFDEVRLAVLRPRNRWQGLEFPDPVSREPYRKSLDPLLSWLEKLEKRKGQELPEDSGRTNCTPPHDVDLTLRSRNQQEPARDSSGQAALPKEGGPPQLKTRSAQDQSVDTTPPLAARSAESPVPLKSNTPALARDPQVPVVNNKQYLLRIAESSMYPRMRLYPAVERAICRVISVSGEYHAVTQNHDSGSGKVHSAVLDGRFNEEQLAVLGKILEAPELSTLSIHESHDLSFVPPLSGNGFMLWISFLREGKTYEYELARPFQLHGDSVTDKAQQKELQVLKPLLAWLTQNMDLSKSPSVSNLLNGRCAEVP